MHFRRIPARNEAHPRVPRDLPRENARADDLGLVRCRLEVRPKEGASKLQSLLKAKRPQFRDSSYLLSPLR